MYRKFFIAFTLVIFTLATNGVALYQCCCKVSVVENVHSCCNSKKKCDTHAHYNKLETAYQSAVNIVIAKVAAPVIAVISNELSAVSGAVNNLQAVSDSSPPDLCVSPQRDVICIWRL